MKKFIFSLILCNILLLSLSANVNKVEKIGIINLQKVIEVCFEGKSSAVKQVIEEKNKLQEDLNKIKNKITDLQKQLAKTNDTKLSEDFSKKIENLRQEYTDIYKKRAPEIDKLEKGIQAPLFEEIYEVVRRISEREGFSIVIRSNSETLFYYSVGSDITDKVIEFFNK